MIIRTTLHQYPRTISTVLTTSLKDAEEFVGAQAKKADISIFATHSSLDQVGDRQRRGPFEFSAKIWVIFVFSAKLCVISPGGHRETVLQDKDLPCPDYALFGQNMVHFALRIELTENPDFTGVSDLA
jgi:hypothetical protein